MRIIEEHVQAGEEATATQASSGLWILAQYITSNLKLNSAPESNAVGSEGQEDEQSSERDRPNAAPTIVNSLNVQILTQNNYIFHGDSDQAAEHPVENHVPIRRETV